MINKLSICLWVIIIGILFLYSFVQVDLGLTLTRASFFQSIQQSFQYIGYFNRSLSAYLFSGIIVLLSVIYVGTLYLIFKKKIMKHTVWVITFLASGILLFSYTATSYDIFNYIFDAKIVTHYHSNPYLHKALDYPNDPMLSFMHWTHRTYPYGPTWLGLTVPLSFLGGGYFLITYYIFKLLAVGSYLLAGLLIYKISKISKLTDPVLALAFFTLNPLVIIETLVSGHNDIPMMVLALLGVYLLLVHKKYSAWLSLALSIGVKFGTAILIPLFLWYPFSGRRNKDFYLILGCLICMIIAVIAASIRTTFQPWYFLFCIPFAALLSKKIYIAIPIIIFSTLVLFQYVPFFYTGNFNTPIPEIMNQLLYVSIVLGCIGFISGIFIEKKNN